MLHTRTCLACAGNEGTAKNFSMAFRPNCRLSSLSADRSSVLKNRRIGSFRKSVLKSRGMKRSYPRSAMREPLCA